MLKTNIHRLHNYRFIYVRYVLGLKWSAPGYIESVWNLKALTGINIYGIPLEELLYGFSFGMYWTGIYEHLTWTQTTKTRSEV
ncbi:MAG: lycopene cyclase domain-containing protein [Armatimonadota bacterium]|nr:lycopene cyclase domain-containing protein [Armatimonadota bacterium]